MVRTGKSTSPREVEKRLLKRQPFLFVAVLSHSDRVTPVLVKVHKLANKIRNSFVQFSGIAIPEIFAIIVSTGEARDARPSRQ